jgi:hypothetical protein
MGPYMSQVGRDRDACQVSIFPITTARIQPQIINNDGSIRVKIISGHMADKRNF